MKKVKFIILFVIVSFMLLMASNSVNAASAQISCNSSATVGDSITISVSGSAVQWNLKLKVNGTVIASSSELENYEGNKAISMSGVYNVAKEGNLTVTLEGSITEASDGSTIRSFASKTITVNAKKEEQAPTPTPTPTPEPEPTPTPSENKNNSEKTSELTAITVDGTKYTNGQTVPAVENSKNSVKVLAVGTSNYSIKVNGNSVSGTTVKLEEGTNEIVVTNLNDGQSIKVYLSRKAKENTTPNIIDESAEEEETKKELKLSKLEVQDFDFSPAFSEDTYAYTINVDMDKKNISKLNLTAIANDESAKVTIQGNENFKEGENIVYIILESADGSKKVTYQITVNKTRTSSEVINVQESDNAKSASDDKANLVDRMIFSVVIVVTILVGGIIITITLIIINNKKEKEEQFENKEELNTNEENEIEEESKRVKNKHKGKRFK